MAERSPSGDPSAAPTSSEQRWNLLVPYRDDLVRFARMMGAGPDAEDLVHEALLAAARYNDLDDRRVWALLANVIAKRVTDRYRRAARAQILIHHRALQQRPRLFEHDIVDRAEAAWVADQLVRILPAEILDVLWRHHVDGAAWAVLAAECGTSTDALKQRVGRAVLHARRRIELLRD